jgi:hypothetical protein
VEDGQATFVMGFTLVDGRIVEIDVLTDPERLARLGLDVDSLGGQARVG